MQRPNHLPVSTCNRSAIGGDEHASCSPPPPRTVGGAVASLLDQSEVIRNGSDAKAKDLQVAGRSASGRDEHALWSPPRPRTVEQPQACSISQRSRCPTAAAPEPRPANRGLRRPRGKTRHTRQARTDQRPRDTLVRRPEADLNHVLLAKKRCSKNLFIFFTKAVTQKCTCGGQQQRTHTCGGQQQHAAGGTRTSRGNLPVRQPAAARGRRRTHQQGEPARAAASSSTRREAAHAQAVGPCPCGDQQQHAATASSDTQRPQ